MNDPKAGDTRTVVKFTDDINKLDEIMPRPVFSRLVSTTKTNTCSIWQPNFFTSGGVWIENDGSFRERIKKSLSKDSK